MSTLKIQIDNESDLALLLLFMKRLNIKIIEHKPVSKGSPVQFLEQLAAQGGISSINDASDWQREIRQDRALYGREL